MEPWWNPGGTLVEPWWNPGGTLVEPQGRPGPPQSLSGLRPQSFQLLGIKRNNNKNTPAGSTTTPPQLFGTWDTPKMGSWTQNWLLFGASKPRAFREMTHPKMVGNATTAHGGCLKEKSELSRSSVAWASFWRLERDFWLHWRCSGGGFTSTLTHQGFKPISHHPFRLTWNPKHHPVVEKSPLAASLHRPLLEAGRRYSKCPVSRG